MLYKTKQLSHHHGPIAKNIKHQPPNRPRLFDGSQRYLAHTWTILVMTIAIETLEMAQRLTAVSSTNFNRYMKGPAVFLELQQLSTMTDMTNWLST